MVVILCTNSGIGYVFTGVCLSLGGCVHPPGRHPVLASRHPPADTPETTTAADILLECILVSLLNFFMGITCVLHVRPHITNYVRSEWSRNTALVTSKQVHYLSHRTVQYDNISIQLIWTVAARTPARADQPVE